MKLRKPNKIAICFVDGNLERTLEQVKQLDGIEDDFTVEWNLRANKFSGSYSNFSQLVNEAIVETSSEFMVFINPKTQINRQDIHTIIDDLCNGYAWSSVCSFGLWGATKELFRRVGMMDERFIGSEYEDNDFAIRLKQFGKAINWRFVLNKYPWSKPVLPQMRGATQTLYPTKWHIHDGVYYRTDLFTEEKRLPEHILKQSREDIYRSWMDWSETQSDEVSHVFREANNATVSNKIVKSSKAKAPAAIRLSQENGMFKFEFLCNQPTRLQLTITNALPIGEERLVLNNHEILKSNTWRKISLEPGEYDLRFFHEGKIVLHDSLYNFPSTRTYNLGLTITDFEVKH